MIDYLVHRPISIFRHVRAIGEIGNITRCFYRTLEGNLIIVKNNVIYSSFKKEIFLLTSETSLTHIASSKSYTIGILFLEIYFSK